MGLSLRDLARKWGWRIGIYIPFTHMNTIYRFMDKRCHGLLDIGGGSGEAMHRLGKGKFTVNLDISLESLRKAKVSSI